MKHLQEVGNAGINWLANDVALLDIEEAGELRAGAVQRVTRLTKAIAD